MKKLNNCDSLNFNHRLQLAVSNGFTIDAFVLTRTAVNEIKIIPTINEIIAGATPDAVPSFATVNPIITSLAKNFILPAATTDGIVVGNGDVKFCA
jgi:hypothetical protein